MWQKLFFILISHIFLKVAQKNREFSETTVRIVGKISAEQSLVINGKGPDSAYFSKTFSPQGESYTTELPVGIWYFYGIYIDGQGNIKCGDVTSPLTFKANSNLLTSFSATLIAKELNLMPITSKTLMKT